MIAPTPSVPLSLCPGRSTSSSTKGPQGLALCPSVFIKIRANSCNSWTTTGGFRDEQ